MPASSARQWRQTAATLAMFTLPWSASAEPFYGAELRYAHDDNLTLASQRADRLDDHSIEGTVDAGMSLALDHDDSIAVGATLRGAAYARFALLDATSLGAYATYRRKLGLGLTTPWVGAGLALSHDDSRDSIRDSDRAELRASLGARLSERLDVSGGYLHERRLARRDDPDVPGISGALYDGSGDSGFARLGYAITERVLVDASCRVRRGDIVATAPQSGPIFRASSAIAEDPAFGPDRYGYRLRATTVSASVAVSYAVDDRSALNLAYTMDRSRAAAGLDYARHVISAAWVWRH